MKYTRKAWYVNKFDIVVAAMIGPMIAVAVILTALMRVGVPRGFALAGWLSLAVLLFINLVFGLTITHKVWGWLWLPVAVLVRVGVTLLASLSGLFLLAMFAYQSQSQQKIDSAWVKDDRSRRYRDGVKDAKTAEGFRAAGGGLWGFLVIHTLEFCEVE